MLYLGIDGGGTKTEFCLADALGREIKSLRLGPSNPVDIGIENTLAIIREGLQVISEDIPCNEISVFAGIAGVLSGGYREQIQACLDTYGFSRAESGSDVHAAVAACLKNKDGVAVILGTGTIAFAQKNGVQKRFGGFGYLFDEGGSGYAIGRDGILAALKSEEGTGEPTALEEMLKKAYGVQALWDAIAPLYQGGKKKIASFAPHVFAAAEQGDDVAWSILQKNMGAVAENINHAAALFSQAIVPVGLVGSITKQKGIILPMIEKKLCTKAKLFVCEHSPVWGALYLAGMEEESC